MPIPVLPYIVERDGGIEKFKDVFTKLFESRTIFLSGEVNETTSSIIVAQLLYLSSDSSEDIYLYINSPGGSVSAGLAIFDTMKYVAPDVSTICIGQAASMGSFLLAAGTKGKRYSLPNTDIMIHQPSGGTGLAQASDIEIVAKHMLRTKEKLTRYLSKMTGQPYDKVLADCDRDTYMSAEEAKEYGIIDSVIKNVSEIE